MSATPTEPKVELLADLLSLAWDVAWSVIVGQLITKGHYGTAAGLAFFFVVGRLGVIVERLGVK